MRNIKREDEADSELTRVGKEQARRLGVVFKGLKIDKVYVSKLRRARDTFREIRKHIGKIPVGFTSKINEHNLGVFGARGKDDWDAYFAAAKKHGKDARYFTPKNGESFSDLYRRAGDFYSYLVNNHIRDNILVVSHGQFLQYLIMEALEIPVDEHNIWKLNNASVSELIIDKKGRVVDFHINDYNHLIRGGMAGQRNKVY